MVDAGSAFALEGASNDPGESLVVISSRGY